MEVWPAGLTVGQHRAWPSPGPVWIGDQGLGFWQGHETGNGEKQWGAFQKQVFLTFVQPLGRLCFSKDLIHRVGLGPRPEEAGPGPQKVPVSHEGSTRAGRPAGVTSLHCSETTLGTTKGLCVKLSTGKVVERVPGSLSPPSPLVLLRVLLLSVSRARRSSGELRTHRALLRPGCVGGS